MHVLTTTLHLLLTRRRLGHTLRLRLGFFGRPLALLLQQRVPSATAAIDLVLVLGSADTPTALTTALIPTLW